MNGGASDLERLITRYLDDEATATERGELERRADADPTVQSLLIEMTAIDREVGRAMRGAMGRTIPLRVRRWKKLHWFEAVGFAAAACLALAIFLNTREKPAQPARLRPAPSAHASWFASPAQRTDVVDQVDPGDVRPRVRLRDTDRHWMVIPARQKGQFLLIEMDRLRTRAIRIQDDF